MFTIIKETIGNLYRESHMKFVAFFVIIPIIFIIISFCIDFHTSSDIDGNFISGLSLLIGFSFSTIVVISDKVQSKKEAIQALADLNDSKRALMNAYIKFGKETVSTISASVYIGLLLIIILILKQFKLGKCDCNYICINQWWESFCNAIIIYFTIIFLYLIFNILKSIYEYFYGQMNASS